MGRKSRAKKERREREQMKSLQSTQPINANVSQQVSLKETVKNSGFDEQTNRIVNTLGVRREEQAEVNQKNLERYFEYLEKNLQLPCLLTGIEDMGCFGWEEFYTFGPGNKKEYEKLKKKNPSYTDEYELIHFIEEFDEEEGIYVRVKRISDNKQFTLPLADLEGTGDSSKNDQILQDYAVWFVNYR